MLLAIDTATFRASVALHDGMALRAECTWEAVNRHTVTLLPRVTQMMDGTRTTINDLTAIAVCIGPGSYTGVRIGLSVAKGITSSKRLPLIGVTTLDILVSSVPYDERPLYAVFAAGRTRIGYARYLWGQDHWQSDTAVYIASWSEFVTQLPGAALVVGEIDAAGRDALSSLGSRVVLPSPARHMRRAGFLADIAWGKLRSNQVDDPSALLPIYAR